MTCRTALAAVRARAQTIRATVRVERAADGYEIWRVKAPPRYRFAHREMHDSMHELTVEARYDETDRRVDAAIELLERMRSGVERCPYPFETACLEWHGEL